MRPSAPSAPSGSFSRADTASVSDLGSRVQRLELSLKELESEILEAITDLHSRLDRQYGYLQLLEGRIRLLHIAIQEVICRAECTDESSVNHSLDLHSLD